MQFKHGRILVEEGKSRLKSLCFLIGDPKPLWCLLRDTGERWRDGGEIGGRWCGVSGVAKRQMLSTAGHLQHLTADGDSPSRRRLLDSSQRRGRCTRRFSSSTASRIDYRRIRFAASNSFSPDLCLLRWWEIERPSVITLETIPSSFLIRVFDEPTFLICWFQSDGFLSFFSFSIPSFQINSAVVQYNLIVGDKYSSPVDGNGSLGLESYDRLFVHWLRTC